MTAFVVSHSRPPCPDVVEDVAKYDIVRNEMRHQTCCSESLTFWVCSQSNSFGGCFVQRFVCFKMMFVYSWKNVGLCLPNRFELKDHLLEELKVWCLTLIFWSFSSVLFCFSQQSLSKMMSISGWMLTISSFPCLSKIQRQESVDSLIEIPGRSFHVFVCFPTKRTILWKLFVFWSNKRKKKKGCEFRFAESLMDNEISYVNVLFVLSMKSLLKKIRTQRKLMMLVSRH